MSTKTTTKRLALATVVAVGAGLLSIVSVSSANAAGTGPTAGTKIGLGANAGDGLTAVLSADTASTAASVGLIASSINASYPLSSTATLVASGKLAIAVTPVIGSKAGILITGGTIDTASATSGIIVTNRNYIAATAVTETIAAIIVPNAGATTVTIQGYSGVTSASTSPDGTLINTLTVSVVSSTTSGAASVSKSGIYYDAPGGTFAYGYTPFGGSGTLVDNPTAGTGTTDFNTKQYATVLARDAYGNALTAGSLITANATNGAYVELVDAVNAPTIDTGATVVITTTAMTVPTLSHNSTSAYVPSVASRKYYSLLVAAPSTAPVTTTVTIAVNGTTIGTKTFTFTGKVAKVVLKSPTNGYTGTPNGGSVSVQYLDAAGNDVTPVHGANVVAYPANVTQDAGTAGLGITTSGSLTQPTSGTYDNKLTYNCTSTNTTGQIAVAFTNPLDGTVISSNGVAVTCSGKADTYTAAFDKKSYVAGDIATLTVTFKDSKGALAADIAAGTDGITNGTDTSTATNVPSITGSQLTVVNAPSASDYTTNGVVTYKFVIGTTAGSYQAVVNFPRVNLQDGVAQSAAYAVTDGGGTSLNDVLKGIVSLIASINKQIAALAKLVTKKK